MILARFYIEASLQATLRPERLERLQPLAFSWATLPRPLLGDPGDLGGSTGQPLSVGKGLPGPERELPVPERRTPDCQDKVWSQLRGPKTQNQPASPNRRWRALRRGKKTGWLSYPKSPPKHTGGKFLSSHNGDWQIASPTDRAKGHRTKQAATAPAGSG